MNEIERRFWFEQIRATLMILVMAVSVSLLITWISSAHLDLAARQHMMVLSLLVPMVVTPLGLAYMVRQNVRYLNFHRQVQHHANCDDLTGLANRRSFTVDAAAQLASANAVQQTIGLLVVDIDWFKRVNDNHGHEAGDETLCHIAQTLLHASPHGALVARLGGEEFTVMCRVDNELELSRIAEALRKATEAAGFYYRGDRIHVTISLGLTLARPDDTLSTLLSRADNALYEAKNHGRNQFALAA